MQVQFDFFTATYWIFFNSLLISSVVAYATITSILVCIVVMQQILGISSTFQISATELQLWQMRLHC